MVREGAHPTPCKGEFGTRTLRSGSEERKEDRAIEQVLLEAEGWRRGGRMEERWQAAVWRLVLVWGG